jgi:hypothetical protein
MKKRVHVWLTISAVVVILAGTAFPAMAQEPAKSVIMIAGVPAEWTGSRLKDTALADVIGRQTPYSVKIRGAFGQGIERFAALDKGTIDISVDIQGKYGIEKNLERENPDLLKKFKYLAVWPVNWKPMALITFKSMPFNSLSEAIKMKYPLKIGVGRIGSYWTADEMFRAAGAPKGVHDIEAWGGKVDNTSDTQEWASLMREGILNACLGFGEFPDPKMEVLHGAKPLKLIDTLQTDQELLRIQKLIPEMGRQVVKPGDALAPKFMDKAVTVVGYLRCYIASEKLDDEVAYNLTKAVWLEKAMLGQAHWDFKVSISEEILQKAQSMGLPFHPGAAKFYKNEKIWK